MALYDRKYLAHFIDPSFGSTTPAVYTRLGKDLEELAIEMNPDVSSIKNILGEASVKVRGYEPQYSVSPFYCDSSDALGTKLRGFINNRSTGSELQTTVVDVLISPADGSTVVEAYREDAIVIPQSYGGDTTGTQIPFEVHYVGNRVSGTFDLSTNKFTVSP